MIEIINKTSDYYNCCLIVFRDVHASQKYFKNIRFLHYVQHGALFLWKICPWKVSAANGNSYKTHDTRKTEFGENVFFMGPAVLD